MITEIAAHEGPVTALEYSADAELLASGSMDDTLALIEPKRASTTPLKVFKTKRTPISFLTFTPRNLLLAAGVFHAE
jgi:WD40 repeat protein